MTKTEDIYLEKIKNTLYLFFNTNLFGIYQIGSGTFNDFLPGKSDLDIVVVIDQQVNEKALDELAKLLDHQNIPCPAEGLDIVIFRKNSILHLVEEPHCEFWFATGEKWEQEDWEGAENREMLIFIELCRRNGKTLFGSSPQTYFPKVKRKWLLRAFHEMLVWHKGKILDPFHDPLGQNSILNACRVLAYFRTEDLLSKTAGGKWYLENVEKDKLVQSALSVRVDDLEVKIEKEEIDALLTKVIKELSIS